ncbi:class I SAM-dependent methyltransferase [Stenotrophomonas sp. SY1]|jgi:SAM-dependent methyltransferase|uniref:class I SAM-dependent methyltransferase n=1 Tax=Stenotrophomonas sp. SY1 TaxID=477235 RepID=UPI001E4D749F|nr:class I SAM-dependent methyltransferase [Stenotrophomonas sp. SY1]MCD9088119.1 class I SAM-dependent methyltransferase [Stenotrophomonas sp. SY1]
MTAEDARAIARAFAPKQPWGNRWDYYYTLLKLRSDPLYPGVLDALRGTTAPVLDMGCGLGLLAHALRHDGQSMPYRGVDNDAAKIRRGHSVATRSALENTGFERVDLATTVPKHRGSVAILDVLQYLPAPAQQALLEQAAAMLDDGSRLVMRMALADRSRRGRISRLGDRAANLIGWMQFRPRHYPDADTLRAQLQRAGLSVTFTPLYGNTPFNNWLLVAQRTG